MILLLTLLHAANAATLTVNVGGDNTLLGFTFRDALTAAAPGDEIVFAPSVTNVTLDAALGPLPPITGDGIVIRGGTQVVLDGVNLTNGSGLEVLGATGVEIYGLKIKRFPGWGIDIRGAKKTKVGDTGARVNAIFSNGLGGIQVRAYNGMPSLSTRLSRNRVGLRLNNSQAGNCLSGGAGCAGIRVRKDARNTELRYNVVGANEGIGIRVHASGTYLFGNRVGTDTTGAAAKGNHGNGIVVSGGSDNIVSGVVLEGNIVVANEGRGVLLGTFTSGALLIGNRIGVDVNGDPLGNSNAGVRIISSWDHVIGGGGPATRNYIGSNGAAGVMIGGSTISVLATNITVADNYIGVAPDGVSPRGNGTWGVLVGGPDGGHAIGTPGHGNVIADNVLGGIWLDGAGSTVFDNFVGLDAAGVTPLPNGLGIYVASPGYGESLGYR